MWMYNSNELYEQYETKKEEQKYILETDSRNKKYKK